MKETGNIARISVCPRCGPTYHGRPAVSRADNKTQLCPDCYARNMIIQEGIRQQPLDSDFGPEQRMPA